MSFERDDFDKSSIYGDSEEAIRGFRPAVSPGKRTLTSSLLRQAPVQARGAPANAAAPAEGGGRSSQGLPDEIRDRFEQAFQADLSEVRVVVDSPAAATMNAEAFTRGNEIHFAPGMFQPDSQRGRELIGHELTHVVQQREGRVAEAQPRAGAGGSAINADPSLEAEAEDLGTRAARGEQVSVRGSGGGVQRAGSADAVAAAILGITYDDKAPAMGQAVAQQAAEAAVATSLEVKIKAAAKKAAEKEAAKLAKAVTEKGKSRGKSTSGSFKDVAKEAARAERDDLESHGSSHDTGLQAERLAYDAAKASGRDAANTKSQEVADAAAASASASALSAASAATAQTIASAAQATVGKVKSAVIGELTDETVVAVGDNPPADPRALPAPVKTQIGEAIQAETVSQALDDQALSKAAQKAAKRQEKTARNAASSDASTDVQGQQGAVLAAATGAARTAAHAKGNEFRTLRGRVQQAVQGESINTALRVFGQGLSALIPDAGDLAEIDALFTIPIPSTPPALISFHFLGSIERAGGPGSKNEDLVTIKMDLMCGGGVNLGFATFLAEVGGYIESCGGSVTQALEQVSYATYRRFRESDVIPRGIVNALWGMGGKSAEGLGISKGDAKRIEAEEWALGVEERLADADRDEDTGEVGKGAYVEGGLKGGVMADIGDGTVDARVHGFTGRHMRAEGTGPNASVPSQQTTGIGGRQKEKRGKDVKGFQVKCAVKAASYATIEASCNVKWISDESGESEVWISIDGFGKINFIGVDQWVAFGFSAVAGLAQLMALARQAYDRYKGKGAEDEGARAAGGVLGALSSTEAMISEGAGNASALLGNSENMMMLTNATGGVGLGSQSTLRVNFENRGGDKALTMMLYQGKAMEIKAPSVAKVQMGAHKRVFQLTILPSLRLEIPGFDLKKD